MKAVIFIDVQNDFVKGGKLAFGYPAEDNLQKIVEFAKTCADAYCNDAASRWCIYVTRDTHEKTLYHSLEHPLWQPLADYLHEKNAPGIDPISGYLATLEGKKLPVEHCVEGTIGWQIVDPLMKVLLGKATFINKPTFGSYDLVGILEEDFGKTGPDEIMLVGYDLSVCVLANAVLLRAKYPNAKIIVKTSLCGDVDEAAFNAAVKVLQMQQVDIEE